MPGNAGLGVWASVPAPVQKEIVTALIAALDATLLPKDEEARDD